MFFRYFIINNLNLFNLRFVFFNCGIIGIHDFFSSEFCHAFFKQISTPIYVRLNFDQTLTIRIDYYCLLFITM